MLQLYFNTWCLIDVSSPPLPDSCFFFLFSFPHLFFYLLSRFRFISCFSAQFFFFFLACLFDLLWFSCASLRLGKGEREGGRLLLFFRLIPRVLSSCFSVLILFTLHKLPRKDGYLRRGLPPRLLFFSSLAPRFLAQVSIGSKIGKDEGKKMKMHTHTSVRLRWAYSWSYIYIYIYAVWVLLVCAQWSKRIFTRRQIVLSRIHWRS